MNSEMMYLMRENIARALYDDLYDDDDPDYRDRAWYRHREWHIGRAEAVMPYILNAERLGLQAALGAIISAAPPINAELSMRGGDGPFVDKSMEAYVEGWRDAHNSVEMIIREGA